MLSSDDMKELTCKQEHLQSLMHDRGADSTESYIELGLNQTALYLCQCLLADQPVLLPTLYKYFQSCIPKSIECPSKPRLLTYIGNEFGDLMSSVCHHRRIGRIFFRTNLDLYILLSHALGQNNQSHCDTSSINKGVSACADQVNKQVHKVSTYMVGQANNDDALIHLDKLIQHVHTISPELWDHISLLTQSGE